MGPVPGKVPGMPPGKLPGKSPSSLRSPPTLPNTPQGIKHGKFGLFFTELELVVASLKVEHPALCNTSVETDVAVAIAANFSQSREQLTSSRQEKLA